MKSKIFSVTGSLNTIMAKNKDKLQLSLESQINEWLDNHNVDVKHIGYTSSIDPTGRDFLSCIVFYKEN